VLDDKPVMLITDGISPNNIEPITDAPLLLDSLINGEVLSALQYRVLWSAIMYVRNINALAALLGMEDRFNIFNDIREFDNESIAIELILEFIKVSKSGDED